MSSASQSPRKIVVGGPGIVTQLLMVASAVSVLATVGLFGWKYFLEQQIANKKQALATYGSSVSDLPLQEIKALSNKLTLVNQLVKEYPYVTNIFPIIEESIENRVTYSSFDLQVLEGKYTLTLEAEAPDYKTVARQMDVLRGEVYKKYLPEVSLEGLKPSNKGKVGFSIRSPVNLQGITPDQLVLTTTLLDQNLSLLVSSSTSSSTIDSSSSSNGFESLNTTPLP